MVGKEKVQIEVARPTLLKPAGENAVLKLSWWGVCEYLLLRSFYNSVRNVGIRLSSAASGDHEISGV